MSMGTKVFAASGSHDQDCCYTHIFHIRPVYELTRVQSCPRADILSLCFIMQHKRKEIQRPMMA